MAAHLQTEGKDTGHRQVLWRLKQKKLLIRQLKNFPAREFAKP